MGDCGRRKGRAPDIFGLNGLGRVETLGKGEAEKLARIFGEAGELPAVFARS